MSRGSRSGWLKNAPLRAGLSAPNGGEFNSASADGAKVYPRDGMERALCLGSTKTHLKTIRHDQTGRPPPGPSMVRVVQRTPRQPLDQNPLLRPRAKELL